MTDRRMETIVKAFLLDSYGPPESLRLAEIDKPVPGPGEVLVRVRATSVNPYDWHHLRGEPYVARLMPGTLGIRRPKITIPGCDVAGTVEAVGTGVTRLRPGDEVYALVEQGGFAEYVAIQESLVAPKPTNLTHEQAAAVPMAAVTALIGLRDDGRIREGQRVLVNGASGGVGTFAVQIARAYGAGVTAVCSTRNLDLVRKLGAEEVVDYTATDFTTMGRRYDVLLDVAGSRSIRAYRRVLSPDGTLVVAGGRPGRWLQPAGHVFASAVAGTFVSQRVAVTDAVACRDKRERLTALTALIEDGAVTPVVERVHPFDELVAAVAYQEAGHAQGKVVVTI